MSEKINILVIGDNYFKPNLIVDSLKRVLKSYLTRINFMELHFPYPIDSLYLEDTSIIPTGMAWDDNMDEEYGNKGVIEYYGSDEMLNGKVKNADILIVHGAAVPGFVIKQADKLKLIGCLRGGPLNIDINTAKESNIQVINTPGKNAQAVAEFTIGLIIAHQRNILNGSRYLSEGRYRPYYYNYSVTGPELQGKKIGLVGFGKIAQLLTGMIKSFGASVYVYDPFVSPSIIEEFGATSCPFDNLLSSCDIISIHARAKKDALPMFGEHQFKMMKKSAIFVNTARGGLVDYPALYKALLDKQIAGAALDVFGVEQFSFYKKLINLENVTATPHIAGSSRETVLRGALMMAEEIKRFIEGEKLQYLIV